MTDTVGPVEAWANGRWMNRYGGIPMLMVSLDSYILFARKIDAQMAALTEALREQLHWWDDDCDDPAFIEMMNRHAALLDAHDAEALRSVKEAQG